MTMRITPLPKGDRLSLTNDGQLEIFFLGTGGAFARTLSNTNFLIVKGNTHLLVDFGITGPDALYNEAGLTPTDIGAFLPTHAHADHVGGMEQLAFENYFHGHKKPDLLITEELTRSLWDNTLSGGMTYLTGCYERMNLNDYFNIIFFERHYQIPDLGRTPNESIVSFMDYGELNLKLFRTNHIQTPCGEPSFLSYGLCVDNRVFFSGDGLLNTSSISKHPHCDAFFHDCSPTPNGTHASLDDLRKLPADTRKKMFLVHYPDDYRNYDVADFAGWAEAGLRYIFD